jgi:hypothetical protein
MKNATFVDSCSTDSSTLGRLTAMFWSAFQFSLCFQPYSPVNSYVNKSVFLMRFGRAGCYQDSYDFEK